MSHALAPSRRQTDQRAALLADALAGLAAPRKTLPCKWLYDPEGSRLFGEITRLPEYYPTRTEMRILAERAPEIAAAAGPRAAVIEFGSGDGKKVLLLLRAMAAPAAYVPVDIAPEWLEEAGGRVREAFPGLAVLPVVADFTASFALPRGLGRAPRLGFFPGSTIGNFAPEEALGFLQRARATLGAGARLVLGADLVKDTARLVAAYDDKAGVTARFNLNLLARLNRDCGADFDLSAFRHQALWNAAASRIEMHLVSQRAQSVHLGGQRIAFAAGETIHTESSAKYREDDLRALAARSGWRAARSWTDAERLFSVWLLEAA